MMHKGETHLVIGGGRSGKSLYAERLLRAYDPPYFYIATAQAVDDEMAIRIDKHRKRRGDSWITREEPLHLVEALEAITPPSSPVLVDCITLWISNLMFEKQNVEEKVHQLCRYIEHVTVGPLVIVSNEVGLGIVPENPVAREFRDLAGWANQLLAASCGKVTWVVAGIPILIKS